jgi:hypothetical protein
MDNMFIFHLHKLVVSVWWRCPHRHLVELHRSYNVRTYQTRMVLTVLYPPNGWLGIFGSWHYYNSGFIYVEWSEIKTYNGHHYLVQYL